MILLNVDLSIAKTIKTTFLFFISQRRFLLMQKMYEKIFNSSRLMCNVVQF